MAIQTRRGNKADFEPDRLQPGEPATALDTGEVFARVGAGVLPLVTAGGGKNRGVLLPSDLPTSSAFCKLNPDGTLSPATFDDFATGVKYTSNSSGEAWQFAGGLMICTLNTTIGVNSDSKATWNYPVPFAPDCFPYVSTPSQVVGSSGMVHANIYYINNIGVEYQFIRADNSLLGAATVGAKLVAIGRWKQ